MKYLLLGTFGCHLCELAEEVLSNCLKDKSDEVEVELIDIAEQTQWQTDYATRIPVLLHQETKQSLSWPFTQDDVNTFIEHYHD